MAIDHLMQRAALPDQSALCDIAIEDGRIVAIGQGLSFEGPCTDLGGKLVIAGLVDTHIHLDKSCLLTKVPSPDGTLAGAIAAVAKAKQTMTAADIYERGRRTVEKSILAGTNLMRTHVEIDPRIGLRGFEAIRQLKADYAFAIDIEICVFPQEGLTNDPGAADLLIQALGQGADLLGGCPYTDPDPKAHLRWVFQTAREFDVDIDLHLDFDLDPSWMSLSDVVSETRRSDYGGRVTAGHITKLSMLKREARLALANRLADAGVGLTALPATDLFLMGRGEDPSPVRGVTPVHEFAQQGVRCSIATNNVLNAFTPFGDCSLTRMANLYAHIAQIGDAAGIAKTLDLVTTKARHLMNRDPTPLRIGQPASFVVLDTSDTLHAVAEAVWPLMAFKDGVQTMERSPARLLAPT